MSLRDHPTSSLISWLFNNHVGGRRKRNGDPKDN